MCTSKGKESGEVDGSTYVMPLLQHQANLVLIQPCTDVWNSAVHYATHTSPPMDRIPVNNTHRFTLQHNAPLKNSIQRTQSPVNNNARINSGFPRTKYGRHYLGLKAVIFPNTTMSKSTTIQSSCTPTNRKKEPQAEVELDDSSVYQIVVVTLYQPTGKR